MANKPWKIEKEDFMPGVKVFSIDFKLLAEELGASNVAEDLAKQANSIAKEYLADGDSAAKWILGEQKFSWQDLFSAFTHGCLNSVSDPPFLIEEMAFSKDKGHHIVRFDPSISFSINLAEAFELAACSSKACDNEIRWQLYNEDWIRYFCQCRPSSRSIVSILEFRTLDFFLPDINSDEWNSSWNVPTLFDQVSLISDALKLIGREETAESVLGDIEIRKKAFDFLLERGSSIKACQELRTLAEKFWVDYLGHRTWENLDNESRNDLVDAFSAEEAVRLGYYSSWQYPLQSLLKVCERELNLSLFVTLKKFKDKITEFVPFNSRSNSRKVTFDSVIRGIKNDKFLTLGELNFVLKFWNDRNMDNCTNLFSQAREFLDKISGNSSDHVSEIIEAFKDTYCDSEIPPWDLVKLRNSCAHPGYEKILSSPEILKKLRKVLGEPPRFLIQTIVLKLRGINDV
ncbi:MAG: hypothetical protein ACOX2I_10105 [Candidatus Ozemobacteraceae bacterium]